MIAPTSKWTWITYAYLTITAIILLIFIIRLVAIARLYITARRYAWKNYIVAESANVKGIFSFFQFIFLSPAENLDEQEKLEILRHEEVHIQKLHSFDILLIHVIGIVCWFNPVIKRYKKSLVQIHEFEADARSVEGRDVNEYCGLLAKVALQSHGYVLANHFTNSFTLKRITMMKTVRKKIKQWKVVTVSVTALMIFFAVACQDQVIQEIKSITKESTMVDEASYDKEVVTIINTLKSNNPGKEYFVMQIPKKEAQEKFKELELQHKSQVKGLVANIDEDGSFYAVFEKGAMSNQLSELTANEDGVYSIVDETSEPKGGMIEFYNHVATEIKYPQEARTKGIEGRVFVEFIVNTDGSISNTQVIKGIGAGCDEEAARVVAAAKPWQPAKVKGQIVKQRMVIPIIFQLENSTKKVELGQAPKDTMEEMVVVGHDKKND